MVSSCIKWRKTDEFTGVTLVSEYGTIHKAHQIILSSGSSLFMKILQNVTHPQPLIFLRGIKDQNLKAILDYIYFGEVSIHQDNIIEFLSDAQDYLLKGIADIIEEMAGEAINNCGNNQDEQLVYGEKERNFRVEEINNDPFKVNKSQLIPKTLASNIIDNNYKDYSFKDEGSSELDTAPGEKKDYNLDEPLGATDSQLAHQSLSDEAKAKRNFYKFLTEDKKAKEREYSRNYKASMNEHRVQFEGDSKVDLQNTLNKLFL